MTPITLQDVVTKVGKRAEVALRLDGNELTVDGATMLLPSEKKDPGDSESGPRDRWGGALLDLAHAFPGHARGDEREKLLFKIVQDGGTGEPTLLDADLYEQLEQKIGAESTLAKQVLATAMRDQYWVEAQKNAHYLLPLHAALPLSFALTRQGASRAPARYRMYRGNLLSFLCWTPRGPNRELMKRFLDVFNGTEGLPRLDALMLDAAKAFAGDQAREVADVDTLLGRRSKTDDVREQALKKHGPYCQATLDRFQRDLGIVLGMRLSRRDRVDALTSLLALHLTLYYYRVAYTFGAALQRAMFACAGRALETKRCEERCLGECPLAGRIRFRVGTSGYQPVKLTDPCVRAYRELDGDYLLAMPANIITANLAQRLLDALAGRDKAVLVPEPSKIAEQLLADRKLRRKFDAGARALTAIVLAENGEREEGGDLLETCLRGDSGLQNLQQAVREIRGTRLRNTSRDVVNQLSKHDSGGSLIRANGSVTFFELDEDYLFLLVNLICRSAGRKVPFSVFLDGLRQYGLAPQNDGERERLASALEKLGMLTRYSDAGEATYVHHHLDA